MDITGKENIPKGKPTLFAVTHANSFYDAVALFLISKENIYALARGDAFNNKVAAAILTAVNCLPIWRITEGKKNMYRNAQTFEKCHEYLKAGDHVLIFSEGRCKNQLDLLPLKRRGTAGMALKAWKDNIDVQVLPVALTYASFKASGLRLNVNYNKPLTKGQFDLSNEKQFYSDFNEKLTDAMSAMISHEFKKPTFFSNPVYYLGWLINFPLYFLVNWLVKKKFGKTVFFHSVIFGVLYGSLGIYWLLLILGIVYLF